MSESWAEAEDMLQNLRRRDGRCWVTKVGGPITTSHILPKRAGDAQARFIYGDFTDKPAHAGLSVLHPEFGFLLTPNLEYWFDNYLVGFRHIGNDQYPWPGCGLSELLQDQWQDLHGIIIAPPDPNSPVNPPPGLFRWHYLQCVLRKICASDYQDINHIVMYKKSLQMKEDPDDDDSSEEDWPSPSVAHFRLRMSCLG
ncbi:hypothetical protein EV361DRAFT_994057 [Lentinula raphanica]|nr:hypothetical protein EV361DRAFT_994057 [Lentinula raphanica]